MALISGFQVKYTSKLLIASGIMSRKAIDMKREPEKVIAQDIILPYLKQLQEEMNLPKIMTYIKKATASKILIIRAESNSIICLYYYMKFGKFKCFDELIIQLKIYYLLPLNVMVLSQCIIRYFVLICLMKFIVLVAAVLGLAIADSCGGNCPSGKCPHCECGTTKRMQDIATWCSKYSWNQACCKCIVSHESGGNANALNYNTNESLDVGLWQINTVNWNSCSGGKPPCDSNTNLGCAIKVYGWGGNTWKLWSTAKGCGC